MQRIYIIKLIVPLLIVFFLIPCVEADEALNVPLIVKDVAGVGSEGYPVTAVVPLSKGSYKDVSKFRIADSSGNTVPAQFDVLNRWWFQDNSIRHVLVNFQPSVGAFTSLTTGTHTYYLRDYGSGGDVATPLYAKEMQDYIEVVTGPLKFTISKKKFNLINELWFDQNENHIFEDSEKMIYSSSDTGGRFEGRLPGDIQFDSSRSDIKVVIEEAGPMRAVIRANAQTKYYDTGNHVHGFAVRIFAYANKPFIKIDYQLQNSAKNKKHAWPLYFKDMKLNFNLNLDSNPIIRVGIGDGKIYRRERGSGLYLAQKFHDTLNVIDMQTNNVLSESKHTEEQLANRVSENFLDVADSGKGVNAMIRYCWQTWPNGIAVDDRNRLSVQLFPQWSAQWYEKTISSTGLYWLEDMQHVYKEILLFFHKSDIADRDLIELAKTFQYPPVVTIPTSWYQKTKATLDMGGLVPFSKSIHSSDERILKYTNSDFKYQTGKYRFNWDNFFISDRKWNTAAAGSWPQGAAHVIATENPGDYYMAEQFAIGELNVRPHWIADYSHEQDYDRLQLNMALPFIARSWRRHNSGSNPSYLDAPYLQGTYGEASPRDDAHGWYYHVEEAYYLTGNPWILDWYKFIGEMRKGQLYHYKTGGGASRSIGHMLASAIQAYRATGDISILEGVRNYINSKLRKEQDSYDGFRNSLCCGKYGEAAFQAGYLIRALINFMEEVRDKDWQAYAEAFQFISGYMEWNYNYSNFANYIDARNGSTGKSHFSALTFVDPQAWYYLHTGKQKYRDQIESYINTGINGGDKAGRSVKKWKGQFEGRYGQFVHENIGKNKPPPNAINDLSAEKTGGNMVVLRWTVPKDAVRYHIVYGNKSISEVMTADPAHLNWWAAKVIGTDKIAAVPGRQQTFNIKYDQSLPLYFAVFSFDENDNMSSMSNVALITLSCEEMSGTSCRLGMICRGDFITANETKTGGLCCRGKCDEHGIVLFYSFGENDVTDSQVYDRSGHANIGKIYGATYRPKSGWTGGAFEFDGVDAYINPSSGTGTGLLNTHTEHTVSAWIKWAGSSDRNCIFREGGQAQGYQICIHPESNTVNYTIAANRKKYNLTCGVDLVPVNKWIYIAGTYNGADGKIGLYINGKECNSLNSGIPLLIPDAIQGWSIAGHPEEGDVYDGAKGGYLKGLISEIRIYNYSLTPEEISSFFQKTRRTEP